MLHIQCTPTHVCALLVGERFGKCSVVWGVSLVTSAALMRLATALERAESRLFPLSGGIVPPLTSPPTTAGGENAPSVSLRGQSVHQIVWRERNGTTPCGLAPCWAVLGMDIPRGYAHRD